METSNQFDSKPLDPSTLVLSTTLGVATLQTVHAMPEPPMYCIAKWHQAHHAIE